jgi:hypothetical protein
MYSIIKFTFRRIVHSIVSMTNGYAAYVAPGIVTVRSVV